MSGDIGSPDVLGIHPGEVEANTPETVLNQREQALQELSQRPDYANSTLLNKFQLQKDTRPLCSFSDIDGTYVFNSTDPLDQAKYRQATGELTNLLAAENIGNIAVTGRDLRMVTEGQSPKTENLPQFDVIVAAVGTEIYVRQTDGTYRLDEAFKKYIEEAMGFNRQEVYAVCKAYLGKVTASAPRLGLEFQPRDRENLLEEGVDSYEEKPYSTDTARTPQPYKISYYFNGSEQERTAMQSGTENYLFDNGHPGLHVVISKDKQLPDGRDRYNMDIVPITKDGAINYLSTEYGSLGVVSGDSGNDIRMIQYGADVAAIPGNVNDELRQVIDQLPTIRETKHFQIKQANGGSRLFYVEPDSLNGPESIKKAMRAYRLLHFLHEQKSKLPNEPLEKPTEL